MKKEINTERFKEMFRIRGISEKKFGTKLDDEQVTTLRSLQRNLASGTMKETVLIECAKRLDCHPAYLEGKSNISIDEVSDNPIYSHYQPLVDSSGIIIPSYESYLSDLNWDSKVNLFKEWLFSMNLYAVHEGNIYTMTDLIQHRLQLNYVYDEVNVYDDLMEECSDLLRRYILAEFED